MSADFLDKIISHKKELLERKKAFYRSLTEKVKNEKLTRYHIFKDAIYHPGDMRLIAEIKKASPSKGLLRQVFDVKQIARSYEEAGAAAISVLIEEKYFLGKPAYLKEAANAVSLPTLAKDFFIDDVQIYEAFYHGANAILLIAAILDDGQMAHLLETASRLDLDCLLEVHNEEELKRALKTDAAIIGVNNRDLKTFEVDFNICRQLIPLIPKDKVIVAESGIKSHAEVKELKNLGAHAVLIGETFLTAEDVSKKIKEVMKGV